MLETLFAPRSTYPVDGIAQLLEVIAASARRQIEALIENDPELLVLWHGIDLAMASMRGILRFGLISDPRGFDAINDYDFREWLRINGASEPLARVTFYPRRLRSRFRLRGWRLSASATRGRSCAARRIADALQLARLDLLEDACRHGRYSLCADVRVTQEARSSFQIFPSPRKSKIGGSRGTCTRRARLCQSSWSSTSRRKSETERNTNR